MTRSEFYTTLTLAKVIADMEYDGFYGLAYALHANTEEVIEMNKIIEKLRPIDSIILSNNSVGHIMNTLFPAED